MKKRILLYPKNCFIVEPFKYWNMNIYLRNLYNDMDNFSNIFKEETLEENNENKTKNKIRNKNKLKSISKKYKNNNKIINNTFRNKRTSDNKSISNNINGKNLDNNLKIPLLNIKSYQDKKSFSKDSSKTQRTKTKSPIYSFINRLKNNHSSSLLNKITNNKIQESNRNKNIISYFKIFNNSTIKDINKFCLSSRNRGNIRLIKENNNHIKKNDDINISKYFNINNNNNNKYLNISMEYNKDKENNNVNNKENIIDLNKINKYINNKNIKINKSFFSKKINKFNKKVNYFSLRKKEKKKMFNDIKKIEENSEQKQKLIKKEKNKISNKISKNKSMAILKIPKQIEFEDIEMESKEEATSYQKQIGHFYRKLDEGLYTNHFFTMLRKDHFFGDEYIIHKTPKYY